MTHRFKIDSAASRTIMAVAFGAVAFGAVAFGAVAAVVMGLATAHAEGQRKTRAQIVMLAPVVITETRRQLPTVYITGRRDTSADGIQGTSAL